MVTGFKKIKDRISTESKKPTIRTALIAAFFAALLFMLLCLVLRITPFGDRTFMYEDMKEQYVDFFSYYSNVWHGKDGFLHSENCGLGADMLGIWAYYLTSPFLLMFVFIPEKHYAVAVTFLIMVKIAATAGTTSLFFSYVRRRLVTGTDISGESRENIDAGNKSTRVRTYTKSDDFLCLCSNVMASMAFAYSGWMIANMTNIMWLDAVIMMPVVLIGFFQMMRGEKRGRSIYIVSVMIMVVMNYYIAAMILMFLGIFALLLVMFSFTEWFTERRQSGLANSGLNVLVNSGLNVAANSGLNAQANGGLNLAANGGLNAEANGGLNVAANSGLNAQANSGLNVQENRLAEEHHINAQMENNKTWSINKKEKAQAGKTCALYIFAQFVTATIASLVLDAWFIVPTAMSLMGSNKDHSQKIGDVATNILPSSEAVGQYISPLSVIPKLFTMSYDSLEIMAGKPNIYFGVVLIIPVILLFFNKKIAPKFKWLMAAFTVIIMMFFCIKPLNTLAHGGTEAYGYLYRYSFIFSFVCITLAYVCLMKLDGISRRAVLLSGGIGGILFVLAFCSKTEFMGTKAWILNGALFAMAFFILWLLAKDEDSSFSRDSGKNVDSSSCRNFGENEDNSSCRNFGKNEDSSSCRNFSKNEDSSSCRYFGKNEGNSFFRKLDKCEDAHNNVNQQEIEEGIGLIKKNLLPKESAIFVLAGIVLVIDISLNFICIYRQSSMNAETVSGYMAKCEEIETGLQALYKLIEEEQIASEKLIEKEQPATEEQIKEERIEEEQLVTEELPEEDRAVTEERIEQIEEEQTEEEQIEEEQIEEEQPVAENSGASFSDKKGIRNLGTEQIRYYPENFGEKSFGYRIESLNPRTPNDSLHFGYPGTTTYNSLLKVQNRLFMYELGFNDNGLYTMYDADNTKCADAILGIKYVIGEDSKNIDDYITENLDVLPASYTSEEKIPELLKLISDAENPFDAQEILWNKFTGRNDEVFEEAICERAKEANACQDAESATRSENRCLAGGGSGSENGCLAGAESGSENGCLAGAESGSENGCLAGGGSGSENGCVAETEPGSENGCVAETESESEAGNVVLKYVIHPSSDGELYFYMKRDKDIDRSLAIFIEDTFISGYGNASCQKVLDLGYFKAGDEVELSIEDYDGLGELPSEPVVVTENVDKLKIE